MPFWVLTIASKAIFDLMRTVQAEKWTVGLDLGAVVLGIACVLFGRFVAPRVARVGRANTRTYPVAPPSKENSRTVSRQDRVFL